MTVQLVARCPVVAGQQHRRLVVTAARKSRKKPGKGGKPKNTSKGFGAPSQSTDSGSGPDVVLKETKSATSQLQQETTRSSESTSDQAAASPQLSRTGKPVGWKVLPEDEEPSWARKEQPDIFNPEEQSIPVVDFVGGGDTEDDLPVASRDEVWRALSSTTVILGVLGALLHVAAARAPDALGADPEAVNALLDWATPSATDVGVAMAVAAAVTGARFALMSVWPEFKEATDRSNRQVLSSLSDVDVLWVAALPGVSEEYVFRGGLMPALGADWRAALIAGAAFGVLHKGGGRNWAFAAWAGAVGTAYGGVALATHSVVAPMLAHTAANVASAAVWRARNLGREDA